MKEKIFGNKGAAILLTLLILTAILAIAFGITSLMWGELKLSQDVPKSLKAYYAAETGIERKLYEIRSDPPNSNDIGSPPSCIGGGAVCLEGSDNCYSVDVNVGATTTIKSYGCYKGIKRAVEISY